MIRLLIALALPVTACAEKSLADWHATHTTKLTKEVTYPDSLDQPPETLFSLVEYPTKLGAMQAYVSKHSDDVKRPAIIWIVGGFPPGGGGETLWSRRDADNDQSASQFRQAGIVTMYPTFRGTGKNPGNREFFFGEAVDVAAAADYLRQQPNVDPKRIYLGGHSTGGTLALLAAAGAARDKFAGVIAFGPIDNPLNYGLDENLIDPANKEEIRLRSPIHWLEEIKAPTLVIEGSDGNHRALLQMKQACSNDKITFHTITGSDHFEILRPINRYLAKQLATDKIADFAISSKELIALVAEQRRGSREAVDLRLLANYRAAAIPINNPQQLQFYFYASTAKPLSLVARDAEAQGFAAGKPQQESNNGQEYFLLTVKRQLVPAKLTALFAISQSFHDLAAKHEAVYDYWSIEE